MPDRLRILYVDDEPELLDIGKLFLEKFGDFSVTTIDSAPAALDLLQQEKFDAIVSDYQMAEMDGIQFLIKVRTILGHIPFVLFTGKGREEIVIKALNEGADFYLQKGGDPESQFAELTHKIRRSVYNREAEERLIIQNRLYSVLSATNKAIVHIRDKEVFFNEICRILVEIGGFRMVWIGLADLECKIIRPVASAGHVDGYLDTINISIEDVPQGRGPTGTAFREGKYYFSNDFSQDPRMEPWRETALKHGYRANAAFPFALGTHNAGVLTLYAPVTGFFDDGVVGLLEEISHEISFATRTIDQEMQKRSAEEALRKQSEQLRTLINSMPDIVCFKDGQGRWLEANDFDLNLFQLDGVPYQGKKDSDLAEYCSFYRDAFLTCESSDEETWNNKAITRCEETIPRPDGTAMVFDVIKVPIFNEDGSRKGLVVIGRDITERKQVEEALVAREEQYRTLLDSAGIGIGYWSYDGVLLHMNRQGCLNMGLDDCRKIIGKNIRDLFPSGPDNEYFLKRIRKMQYSETDTHYEDEVPMPAGRRWFLSTFSNVKDDKGTKTGVQILSVDITERKMAEERLRESEARFRMLSDAAFEGIMIHDNGLIVDSNPRFAEMFGYSPEEIVGCNGFEFMLTSDSLDAISKWKESGFIGSIDVTGIRKDGSLFYGETTSGSVLWQGKQHTIVKMRDITGRKRAEEALQEKTEELDQYFSTSLDLFCIADTDGYFRRLNPEWEVSLGYSLADLEGARFLDFVHPDDIAATLDAIADLDKKKIVLNFTNRYRCKDGSYRWIEWRSFPSPKNNLIFAAARDITERRWIEEELRNSEQRYRSLFENMLEGFAYCRMLYDEHGLPKDFIYLNVNSSFDRIIGTTTVIGKPVTDVFPGIREEMPQLFEIYGRVASTGEPESFDLDFTPSNKWLHISVYSPAKEYFVAIFDDITEHKMIEYETKFHEEELSRFSVALGIANKKLTLLSSITRHDINNQLTVLMGYLELLEMKQPDSSFSDYFNKITSASERIQAMIQFTKTYEGIGVNAPIWQNTHELVNTAGKEVVLGDIKLVNDIPADMAMFADQLIVKVFFNLMDNAVRYGGRITTIRFTVEKRDSDCVIVCEDDGNGIPAEDKEKIFERGFGKNTGLGLFLSREILSITGITIKETGEPGKGARFEMTVPKGMYR